MPNDKINMADIDIRKLNDSHKPILSSFKSYEKELADFLVEDAIDNQGRSISITYLWFYKPTKELVAYISVLTDAINLQGNLKANIPLYSFIESLRSEEFLENHKDLRLIAKELEKISTIFCTDVLFGSHAKEKATKSSDIDILLIAPSPEEVENEANTIAKMLSYPLHINAISEESFEEMKSKKGLNVVNEIKGNHIILAGHEAYCRLMAK